MNFLDFIFPKKCVSCGQFGAYICKKCFATIDFVEKPICAVCGRQAVGGRTHPGCFGRYRLDGLVVACRYSGVPRVVIQKIKYRWLTSASSVLADLIVGSFWKYEIPDNVTLVPVPLHKLRKKWRGFNQSELVAKSLSEKFSVRMEPNLLHRNVNTKTQVGLTRDERMKNIKGAFSVNKKSEIKGRNFILVDDVYTTGATMGEACRVLKKNGASVVWGLAVALD